MRRFNLRLRLSLILLLRAVFGSGSNHRENHLEPFKHLEGVRLLRGHENYIAALQLTSLAGNQGLDLAVEHMHVASRVALSSLICVVRSDNASRTPLN